MTLLRNRQRLFVDRCIDALQEHGNTLGVAVTGFGKTWALSAAVGELIKGKESKACVLAHRDELTNQNQQKFQRVVPNVSTSILNASEKSWSGKTTFAMVQTLCREANLDRMPALDLLVIDEAHHAVASSYLKIIDHAKSLNPGLKVFGVTASPVRGDKKGLRSVFTNVADQVKLREVINDGHLVPPRTFVIDVGVQSDLEQVRVSANDFDMNEVEAILDHQVINDSVVRHWQEKAGDRKTIVFCSTVRHAQNVCKAFVDAGIKSAVIDGSMSKANRQALIEQFDKGDLQVLLNCYVLTEGFDSQPVSCIVMLRPSSQKSTFIQCVGRGLRIVDPNEYPGITKTDCIVLDFGTSSILHGTLETDANLDGYSGESKGEAPRKQCPDCEADLPAAVQECSICGHQFSSKKSDDVTLLADFVMSEIDLLKRSSFRWCDVFEDNAAFMATGFEAWAGVFQLNGHWYGLGGRKRIATRLLAKGDRTVCLAAADDWLNTHETEEAANKSKRWLSQAATPQQLKFLAPKYRHDFGLTRYHASCLLAFQFNKKDIQQQVFRAANREAA
jgi:superfamily II DNA or RNA helicase